MNEISDTRKIYTVAELNQCARQLLEGHYSQIWVEGELSNLIRASSGHWYFSLKDERAQVRCAMFANRNRHLRFSPQNGMQVVLRGKASIYEGRGEYQLIAENLTRAGEGLLQQQFEVLKKKLASEGLFAAERKQPLPALPRHIGIITSPTGAAIRDILTVLRRRFPAIPVTLIPSLVQGADAADQIVSALKLANHPPKGITSFDVLILGRGGGSLEDLWCFNDERVAIAISESDIPVVSAVGHEVDFTIADFVADVRAATPSAAAELVVPDQKEWYSRLQKLARLLAKETGQTLNRKEQQLKTLRKRLRHPGQQLQDYAQRIDRLENSLNLALTNQLKLAQVQLARLRSELARNDPSWRINAHQESNRQLSMRLHNAIKQQLERTRKRLQQGSQALNTLSPLQTLSRGYAIVTNENQQIIRDIAQLDCGDRVVAQVARGKLHCTVEDLEA